MKQFFLLFLLIGHLFIAVGAQSSSQPNAEGGADSYLQRATNYLKQKQYANAIESFKQGLRVNPKDPLLHYGLGLTYAEIKDWKRASEEAQVLKHLDEKNADELTTNILRGEANEAINLDNYRLARLKYDEAIKISPYDVRSLINLGVIQVVHYEEYEEGIKNLKQGLILKEIDEFPSEKQTGRLMGGFAYAKLWGKNQDPNAKRMAITFIKEYLTDKRPSTLTAEFESEYKKQVQEYLRTLSSPSGIWIPDPEFHLGGIFKPILAYQILDKGSYVSFGSIKSENVSWQAGGSLIWNGSAFRGNVTWGIVLPELRSMAGYEGDVMLRFSEDFETLTGSINFKKNFRTVDGKETIIPPFTRQITLRRKK
jgi:tetratricopeptide (TPR) repeat protein